LPIRACGSQCRRGERALTAKQAKAFDVYERRSIEVATGDRLCSRQTGVRTDSRPQTVNRAVAEVDRTGRICLEDGRTCLLVSGTSHTDMRNRARSQGKLGGMPVIISGDGMRKELFTSRPRGGGVQVITSDKESLRESVAQSSVRNRPPNVRAKWEPSSCAVRAAESSRRGTWRCV